MEFVDWGEIPYLKATEKQLQLVEQVASQASDDTIIFCTHPPVVTLGRSSTPEDVMGWNGDVAESSRGGRATYHGPEQLVIYPVINLTREHKVLRTRDVHHYLRLLEQSLIDGLARLDVAAEVRETKTYDTNGKELLMTGVWVGEQKIASIGIAVRKWTTYHGAALNITSSNRAFSGISPCGFTQNTMTSLQQVLGRETDRASLIEIFQQSFSKNFV